MSAESAVYEALVYACSQDAQLLKPAEQKLSEWETQPGFHLTLVKFFSDQSIDANVRWMASLYFKNGVLKYWRKNAPKLVGMFRWGEEDIVLIDFVLFFQRYCLGGKDRDKEDAVDEI